MAISPPIMLRRHSFVKAIEPALRGACDVRRGQRLLLAVSGGRDSIALLHALHALAEAKQWSLDVQVGHIDHQLRHESATDAAFVQHASDALQLPFHLRRIAPGDRDGNLEANARTERYEALAAVADAIAADAIVTAHHADDQLETLLMRLIRGAGLEGLSGMGPVTELAGRRVLRPMLSIDGRMIKDFCTEAGLNWREDATNSDTDRWRARLRADVLPVLTDLRPDAAIKASEAAALLGESAAVLDAIVKENARQVLRPTGEGWTIAVSDLRPLPRLLQVSVLRRCLRDAGVSSDRLPRRTIEQIVDAALGPRGDCRRFQLADQRTVVLEAGTIQLVRAGR